MAYQLIYIPNDGTQNIPFCRLKQLVENFEHGSKGIRHWPINGYTSPMMVNKITPSVD